MSFWSWWTSTGDGIDAAEEIIEQGGADAFSDEDLRHLGEENGTSNIDAFVESAGEELAAYLERQDIQENGTTFEKFRHGCRLLDEEKYPILSAIFHL